VLAISEPPRLIPRSTPSALLGREADLRALRALRTDAGGGALVVRGEPGIGKTALLQAAADDARADGLQVLWATGVPSERRLPLAGLHQLLRPLMGARSTLPPPQREALDAAFGVVHTPAPDDFLVGLAALELLSQAAPAAPLLLIADDAQWLDQPTLAVLSFIARRVQDEPIVLLIATRAVADDLDLRTLALDRLPADAAADLLDAGGADLPPSVRERVLEHAAGHPLALVELPIAFAQPLRNGPMPLPFGLPLTERLERAFTDLVDALPEATARLLMLAACDDRSRVGEVLAAGGASLDALGPAVAAGLLALDGTELRFSHPLLRCAVYQRAGLAARHAAHAALAAVLADRPMRRAWHRAASSLGPDAAVAADLAAAAAAAAQDGDLGRAVAALECAARLSEDPATEGARLLDAADLAFELGRPELVDRLVAEAEPLALHALDRLRVTWIRERFDDGPPGDVDGVRLLTALAGQAAAAGDPDKAMDLLERAARKTAWTDPGQDARGAIVALADRLDLAPDDARRLVALSLAAPLTRGAEVVATLEARRLQSDLDADTALRLGRAALAVGHDESAFRFLTVARDGLRAQGRPALAAQALALRAWAAAAVSRWDVAAADADEGAQLAQRTGQPLWAARANAAGALVAGLAGTRERAEELAAAAERAAFPTRASAVLAEVQIARGRTALGHGHHVDAHHHLARVFDAGDPAAHHAQQLGAVADLAEAALPSGHRDGARALLDEMEASIPPAPRAPAQSALRFARAVLADDGDADARFAAAFDADPSPLPFARARLQLALGTWLRRRRRVLESRAPLESAAETFDGLGVAPWAERARQELRATGMTSRRSPESRDELTPQELQIAQMAGAGLSNRQIGQRLFLSHRTVGSHLYRVFPKLGIASRSELGRVLAAVETGATGALRPAVSAAA
jgi:DNA-binding CsgD family transcriptional regulator